MGNKRTEWFLEHSEEECPSCAKNRIESTLGFYLGTFKGEDAQRYACTHEECNFEDIQYIADLHKQAEQEQNN